MIFYIENNDAEFAAHILQFYRFPDMQLCGCKLNEVPLGLHHNNTVVTFNIGELDWDNWHNICSTGRTLCQLAYDTAMTWQGTDWYTWLKHPSFIPRYERPDVIEYMSDVNFNLVQSREIQQALGTGRAWTEYLTHTNTKCIEDYLI